MRRRLGEEIGGEKVVAKIDQPVAVEVITTQGLFPRVRIASARRAIGRHKGRLPGAFQRRSANYGRRRRALSGQLALNARYRFYCKQHDAESIAKINPGR